MLIRATLFKCYLRNKARGERDGSYLIFPGLKPREDTCANSKSNPDDYSKVGLKTEKKAPDNREHSVLIEQNRIFVGNVLGSTSS